MSIEIKNNVKAIRTAIKKSKHVYVMNQLTEGYVRVYKGDLLRDISDWDGAGNIKDDMYIRFGDDTSQLFIN